MFFVPSDLPIETEIKFAYGDFSCAGTAQSVSRLNCRAPLQAETRGAVGVEIEGDDGQDVLEMEIQDIFFRFKKIGLCCIKQVIWLYRFACRGTYAWYEITKCLQKLFALCTACR